MPRIEYVVDLNDQEREHLLEVTRHGKSSARKIKRAHILLKADQDLSDAQIAQGRSPPDLVYTPIDVTSPRTQLNLENVPNSHLHFRLIDEHLAIIDYIVLPPNYSRVETLELSIEWFH